MRSILLHAHDDAGFPSRLQAALDIARQCSAYITCLQPISWDVVMPGDLYGAMAVEVGPIAMAQAKAFREETEARLQREDVRWEWVDEAGMAEGRLLEYAALSDLVVVSAEPAAGGRGRPSALVGTLAIDGRSPLLVVPADYTPIRLDGPALVAWNGSPESSRALRAALPLLLQASSVTLATVIEPEPDEEVDLPPLSGAAYLAKYGIESEVVELGRGADSIAETLQQAALKQECSYMVMGAYGHSRLMEVLFGGVTRKALTDPKLPLLLAH